MIVNNKPWQEHEHFRQNKYYAMKACGKYGWCEENKAIPGKIYCSLGKSEFGVEELLWISMTDLCLRKYEIPVNINGDSDVFVSSTRGIIRNLNDIYVKQLETSSEKDVDWRMDKDF